VTAFLNFIGGKWRPSARSTAARRAPYGAMERLLLLAGFSFLSPAFAQTAAGQATPVLAGRVELVEGDVRFFDRAMTMRRPVTEDSIFEGESIATGTDGEVHLRMEDGGLIAVRPATKMRIAKFRAQGDESDVMTIGLLEGTLRSTTGWIAKFGRNNYQVRTPTTTIGVRGTDHEPFHIPAGSPLGEPGTYDKVNQGGTYMQTPQGRVDIAPGRAGFAGLRRAERPRVLESIPAHFRPTRHEERITRRYHEIQQRLPQLRENRRKLVQVRAAKVEQKREARKVQRFDKKEKRLKRGEQHNTERTERREKKLHEKK
jgi:FecR protein